MASTCSDFAIDYQRCVLLTTLTQQCIAVFELHFIEYICGQVLKNSFKSCMKCAIFLPVFNVISINVYVFLEYVIHLFFSVQTCKFCDNHYHYNHSVVQLHTYLYITMQFVLLCT